MAARARTERVRLDQALVDRGLVPSRARARALILAGRVRRGGEILDKAGIRVDPGLPIEVDDAPRDVGRGASKLRGVLDDLGVEVASRDALDVGASTGGFTQVLLERGASRIVALDVGRGQLDWSLRNDPRVVVLEGVNARGVEPTDLPFVPSIAVIDVSFISLERVLGPVARCLEASGEIVALVKPQFEVGRGRVGRGGIVRDPALHREVLRRVAALASSAGLAVRGIRPSSLRGADGNQEYFMRLGRTGEGLDGAALEAAVERALELAAESGP